MTTETKRTLNRMKTGDEKMKKLRSKKRACSRCGKQKDKLSLTTLPGVLRKRTEAEQEAEKKRIEEKRPLTQDEVVADKRRRKISVCTDCVKQIIAYIEEEKQKTKNVTNGIVTEGEKENDRNDNKGDEEKDSRLAESTDAATGAKEKRE